MAYFIARRKNFPAQKSHTSYPHHAITMRLVSHDQTTCPPAPRLIRVLPSTSGQVYMNGVQALARIPMAQVRRDQAAGLKNGGFISGYRGSPLGLLDKTLVLAKPYLDQYNIRFQPGVNEELAATMVWGSQQLHLSKEAQYDGLVGIWYGKGPDVDRCCQTTKVGP